MLRSITGVLLVLLMTATLSAQRVPTKPPIKVKPGPVTEAGQQYRVLLGEFGQQRLAYSKAYREAKTAADRVKVRQELYPKPEKLAGKFLVLAKEHPDDPVAVQALVWVVSNVRIGRAPAEAIDLLIENNIEDKAMVAVCQRLMRNTSPPARRLLEQVLEKNPLREAKGQACFGLMMQSKYAARANPAKEADVKKFAERVIKDFADLKHYRGTIGEAAKRELYEVQNLGIGKTAPEIAGEDIDGVKFKLTDYRGKVVVIDFWGDW